MTANQPAEQPQPQAGMKTKSKKWWKTPELWATVVTALVMFPAVSFAEDAALDTDVSYTVTAVVAAVIAVTSFVFLRQNTGRARDGVLFGLWLVFLLTAVRHTAKAIDMAETLLIWILVALFLAIAAWSHYRNGGKSQTGVRDGSSG